MFQIYHSNQLDLLKELLVHLIQSEPLADPFEAEQILVQSPGMAQWLKLQLAESLGIAANIDFPLPASFIWQMFKHVLPDIPERSAFNKEAMSWKLMGLLPELLESEPFAALQHYLADDPEQRRLYQLCQKIADIFDQYLVYRPDWIEAWEQGGNQHADTHPWQPILWRALVEKTAALEQSHYHRANLYQDFISRLEQASSVDQRLPRRVFVFGISALPPKYMQALYALGQRIDVHFLLTNPCRYYWGDISDPKWLRKLAARRRIQLSKQLEGFSEAGDASLFQQDVDPASLFDSDGIQHVGNPLLASMGKLGRDNLYLLAEMEVEEIQAFVDISGDSLLHLLQHDILELKDGSVVVHDAETVGYSYHKTSIPVDDHSLMLHACHSPMREVEVLHDQLLAMMEADPELTPKEIIVMMPDVNSYSPYIQAVFGAASGKRYIPFSISDRSAQQENPILLSFLKLLRLPLARCSVSDLLGILEVPAVLARFGLSQDDFEHLRQWIEEACIRWGLDEQDAARFELPDMQQNTWLFGLRRMLLGYATGEAHMYGHILPYAEIQGMEADRLGKLAHFIEQLILLMEELDTPRSLAAWITLNNHLLARFYQVSGDEEYVLKLIRDTLQALQEQLQDAAFEQDLSPQILFDYLSASLQSQRSSQRFLAGQVNFCTLMPMRSIPFKVVCLLGMNDGIYPRSIPPMGFDLMANNLRRGDRSRRDDDRYLFLEALLSAQQRLYISYIGRSVRDNTEKIPSVLVNELLDYCLQSYVLTGEEADSADETAVSLHQHLLTVHPLQPFSPYYFTEGEGFSYAEEWLPALISESPLVPFWEQALASPEQEQGMQEFELAELLRFYRQPCQYFFNRRLKVFFDEIQQEMLDDEPFDLDALANYQLKAGLLSAYLEQGNSETYRTQQQASGQLPYGNFGQLLLAEQDQKMAALADKILPKLSQPEEDIEVNISLLQGQLQGWLKGHYQCGLVRYKPGEMKGKELLRHWIEHLCYCLSVEKPKPTYLLDTEGEHQLAPLSKVAARTHLFALFRRYQEGMCHPLPFFPQTAWGWLNTIMEQKEKDWQPSQNEKQQQKADKIAQEYFVGGYMRIGEGENSYVRRSYPEWNEATYASLKELASAVLLPLRMALSSKDEDAAV